MEKPDLCEKCNNTKIVHVNGKGKCTVRNCSCVTYVSSVINTILRHIPAEAEITRVEYEGERIALYPKNPKFLQQNSYIVSDVVNMVKRRVVVRTDNTSG